MHGNWYNWEKGERINNLWRIIDCIFDFWRYLLEKRYNLKLETAEIINIFPPIPYSLLPNYSIKPRILTEHISIKHRSY